MQRIINPYNFIPFGTDLIEENNKQTREQAYRDGERLKSGWLDVSMIPSKAVIIPDGAHPEYINPEDGKKIANPSDWDRRNSHKQYDFMHRFVEGGKKEYYIPGSSIRGMIRSVYEAATDSCFPFLLADTKKPISQRVPLYAALKKRGLLAREKINEQQKEYVWRLYSVYAEIEKVSIIEENKTIIKKNGKEDKTVSYHLKTADNIEITLPTGTHVKGKGVLQYNIPVDIDKPYHIAYLTKKEKVFEWSVSDDEPYRLLNSVLCRDNVKGNQFHRNEKPARDLKKALDKAKISGGMVPVYYFIVKRKHVDYEEELVYLSNSSVGRIAQKRRWKDIMGEHAPCTGPELCPACRLFGALGLEHGLKSHVRITDALPEEGVSIDDNKKYVTIDILGEPRTSAFEFYLTRPEGASYWNFDFYGTTSQDENGGNHTDYYDLKAATPRGRKMYWHGEPRTIEKKSKLNATMATIEKTPFVFRIYFDEISKKQLRSLIWAVTLGDNKQESKYQHKIGHAKPLGYGSVNLWITGGYFRKVEKTEQGLQVSTIPIDMQTMAQGETEICEEQMKDLLRISDIHAAENHAVQYPLGPKDKIFNWFVENRIRAEEVSTLPLLSDEDVSIESEVRKERFNYKEGDKCKGSVTGFNDGSGMMVTLENSDPKSKFVFYRNTYKKVSFGTLEQFFPEGTKVTLEYKGKNEKGKEQWYVVD